MPKLALRILVCDRHDAVRQGLVSVLRKARWKVVGDTGNGRDAVRLAREKKATLVITDITMPRLNGLLAVRRIMDENADMRILIYSSDVEDHHIERAMRVGIHGFVLKSQPNSALVAAVRAIQSGSFYFSPVITRHIQRESSLPGYARTESTGLSERQLEIMQLIAEGMSNKAIAAELGISFTTVRHHREKLMAKTKMRDAASLTQFALRAGLIQL